MQGKAVTREATREAKLKRGGMKERFDAEFFFTFCSVSHIFKERFCSILNLVSFDGFGFRWGLELGCRSLGQSLEVFVKNVSPASPAQR